MILKKGLDKFCPVELTLYLRDGRLPVTCDGRVVWAVKREREFDLGIEFIDIKEKDAVRIERTVQECLKAQGNSLDNR